MRQVQHSVVAQPFPMRRPRFATMTLLSAGVTIALTVGIFAIGSLTTSPSAVPAPQAQRHEQIVDGWAPAVAAAEGARLARLEDGYLAGLLTTRMSAGDPVDGYLAGLLATHASGNLVDGWLPAATIDIPSEDPRDGWEAALVR